MVTQDTIRANSLMRYRRQTGSQRNQRHRARQRSYRTRPSYRVQIRSANANPIGIVVSFPRPGRGKTSRGQVNTRLEAATNPSAIDTIGAGEILYVAPEFRYSEETKSKIIQMIVERRGARSGLNEPLSLKGTRQRTQLRPATATPTIHPIAHEFSSGIGGIIPEERVALMVDRIIRAVIDRTRNPEYSVDIDGALSFETTLDDGAFMMCEVSIAGNINAGLYSDADGDLERFMAQATEQELLDLF